MKYTGTEKHIITVIAIGMCIGFFLINRDEATQEVESGKDAYFVTEGEPNETTP